MIRLTRLSGQEFWLNADMIESMESTPDTVLSLADGRRIVVQEPPALVAQMCVSFRAAILMSAGGVILEEAMLTHSAHEATRVASGTPSQRPTTLELDERGPSTGRTS
jgi:flagellar protein FlbD